MKQPPSRWINLPDGTQWIRPALESDDRHGPAWKLRYAPTTMTRYDELALAHMAEAYGYLLLETTQDQRNRICAGVRKHMSDEQKEQA